MLCKPQNIWCSRSKGNLAQVNQISQEVPAKAAANIPQKAEGLRISLHGCLQHLMQQNELVQRQ